MNFSIATLLSNFPDDKSVAPKVLEKKLACDDDDNLGKLLIALEALERTGILVKERGRYRRDADDGLVEAKLRCSSKGFCFAIQDAEGAEDIYVRESYLSTAWNGDRVLVKVIKDGSRRRSPEGEVRLILERANPSVLARVKLVDDEFRAVPLDDRLLFEIHLEPDERLKDAVDYLVHVEVQRYPLGDNPPQGRVVQVLGSDAEAANDIDIVCCKHDLPRSFPPKVLESLKDISAEISAKEAKQRLDLRHLKTLAFVEDPLSPGCVERAYSITRFARDQWQVGIHVADVGRLVALNSPAEREARRRGTSVYLGETMLPLFPDEIIEAASFTPEGDRSAISLLITLDETGQILEYEVQPSILLLDRLVSYEETQTFLGEDASQPQSKSEKDLAATLKEFQQVSQLLREQRYLRGSFDLYLPEASTHFGDEVPLGAPVFNTQPIINAVTYEFVVTANQLIADHLTALGVPALYCIQLQPDIDDVHDAIKLAGNMDLELWLEDEEQAFPSDFKQFADQVSGTDDEKILNYLLEAVIRPHYYSNQPGVHFGLALDDGYTHLNAPLQRYVDYVIQQVLHAVFTQGRDRRTSRSKESVNLHHSSCHGQINWNVLPPGVQSELEEHLSVLTIPLTERERLALEAENDLNGLQKAGAMKERTGEVFRGLITGVQSYGFFVEIEAGENGMAPPRLEGLVHVSSLKDDWYEYRSRQQTLVGRKNRKQYRLGDRVDVQVKSVDYYRQQIDLAPVGGGSEAPPNDDDDNFFGEEE
ncbi:MAG: VacB/RNase II family 3'-5' exoribonuclease [Phormidium sp. BM_Day4_Bin.17]|nr:VacB/RNase II family 3'-5' exoribonuclease [Phormidium sp. BM_Day4_Bin.17]UCJ12971.1 MAG: ribonuclease R [Phormidium sp. PBR-2020]